MAIGANGCCFHASLNSISFSHWHGEDYGTTIVTVSLGAAWPASLAALVYFHFAGGVGCGGVGGVGGIDGREFQVSGVLDGQDVFVEVGGVGILQGGRFFDVAL